MINNHYIFMYVTVADFPENKPARAAYQAAALPLVCTTKSQWHVFRRSYMSFDDVMHLLNEYSKSVALKSFSKDKFDKCNKKMDTILFTSWPRKYLK